MENCALNVGVVVDPPYIKQDYINVKQSDTVSNRMRKGGPEFELFNQIFVNILKCRLNFTQIPTYDRSYEMLSGGIIDTIILRDTPDIFYDYMSNHSSIVFSSSVGEEGLVVYFKQLYRSGHVNLFARVDVQAIIVILLLTFFIQLLSHYAKSYIQAKKQLVSVGWFLFVTALLGLFSNLMTVDLVTQSRVPVDSFTDMNDLVDKLYSGECVAFNLGADIIDHVQQFAIGRARYDWVPKLKIAEQRSPPTVMDTRDNVARQLLKGDGCRIIFDYMSARKFYSRRYNGISRKEMMSDLAVMPSVYVMNKYTVPPELLNVINIVIASESIVALPTRISNIFYPKNLLAEKSHESKDNAVFHKVLEALKFLAIGVAISAVMMVVENMYSRFQQVRILSVVNVTVPHDVKPKIPRCAKFSEKQDLTIIKGFMKNKNELEATFNYGKGRTLKEKEAIWQGITSVNSLGIAIRTHKQVNDRWKNMFSSYKKQKKSVTGTGGGKAFEYKAYMKHIDNFKNNDPTVVGVEGGGCESADTETKSLPNFGTIFGQTAKENENSKQLEIADTSLNSNVTQKRKYEMGSGVNEIDTASCSNSKKSHSDRTKFIDKNNGQHKQIEKVTTKSVTAAVAKKTQLGMEVLHLDKLAADERLINERKRGKLLDLKLQNVKSKEHVLKVQASFWKIAFDDKVRERVAAATNGTLHYVLVDQPNEIDEIDTIDHKETIN